MWHSVNEPHYLPLLTIFTGITASRGDGLNSLNIRTCYANCVSFPSADKTEDDRGGL